MATETTNDLPDWALGDFYVAETFGTANIREISSTFSLSFVAEVIRGLPADYLMALFGALLKGGYGNFRDLVWAQAALDNPKCPDSVVALIWIMDPESSDQGWCTQKAERILEERGFTVTSSSEDYEGEHESSCPTCGAWRLSEAEQAYEDDVDDDRCRLKDLVRNGEPGLPEDLQLIFRAADR